MVGAYRLAVGAAAGRPQTASGRASSARRPELPG